MPRRSQRCSHKDHKEFFVIFVSFVALISVSFVAGCRGREASSTEHTLVERARVAMGSELRLTAWTDEEIRAVEAFERVFDEFDRLDRLMSVWHEDSDVSRISRAAGRDPVRVAPETLEVLEIAHEISEWTGGKFDVTFGALSGLWKFDHDQDGTVPRRQDVAARLPLVDYRALDIDAAAGTAFLRRPGMRVHLGGVAKGYAVDHAAGLLRSHRIVDFMIQAGGDLYVAGRRGDRAWRGAIRDPRADRLMAALELQDETLSTSGDYERFFIRDGRRYHHILDPDTGEPAAGVRSATVVARRAVLADALSTSAFILGPEAGMHLIERLPDVEGVIVDDRSHVLISSGLKGRMEMLAEPASAD